MTRTASKTMSGTPPKSPRLIAGLNTQSSMSTQTRGNHNTDGANANVEPISLPQETVYSLLGNKRRKHALTVLSQVGEIDRVELSEEVASIEYDKPAADLYSQERKRVIISLYQCHLPKLDDAGVVEWDRESETVSLGPNAEKVLNQMDVPAQGIVERFKEKLLG